MQLAGQRAPRQKWMPDESQMRLARRVLVM